MTQMHTLGLALRSRLSRGLTSAALAALATLNVLALAPADNPAIVVPAQAQTILPLDGVRVGMRGYGLTVFHGQTIEPFAVEVVSIQRDFGPRRGVIWIRCPDERMQKTGPVSGMSGSPIYLWDDDLPDDQHILGRGGKLIGAFAYGYGLSKDCYVGVQPIELMRGAADRLTQEQSAGAPKPASYERTLASARAREIFAAQMQSLLQSVPRAASSGVDPYWRARAIWTTVRPDLAHALTLPADPAPGEVGSPVAMDGFAAPQALRPLALPLMTPVPADAAICRLIAPLGLMPLSAGAAPAGLATQPPPNVDLAQLRIAPGSVLSVPLAWGDLNLAAAGTVTDVLPDGSVLGFGHAFQGIGQIAMPMAGGFVHFIQPALNNSFKLSGSGPIVGTLTRDEPSAVAGRSGIEFESAPVRVQVTLPGREPLLYQYTAVRDRTYMATIITTLALQSAVAERALPPDHTLVIDGSITLPGDRSLTVASQSAMGGTYKLIMELFPTLGALAANPFEAVLPEAVDLRIQVIDEVRSLELTHVAVSPRQVMPGQTVSLAVRFQTYRGPVRDHTYKIRIPEHLPDGDYQLAVSGPDGYFRQLVMSRPHLLDATRLDELLDVLEMTAAIPSQTLFVTLVGLNGGVAIGRNELPALPQSRAAIIADKSHTLATAFATMHTHRIPVDGLPEGSFAVDLTVRANPANVE